MVYVSYASSVGVGVNDGVAVSVGVGVNVKVAVGRNVGVKVGVDVNVAVDVKVAVAVGSGVGVIKIFVTLLQASMDTAMIKNSFFIFKFSPFGVWSVSSQKHGER
jgi:hypothetical protein